MLSDRLNQVGLREHVACWESLLRTLGTVMPSEELNLLCSGRCWKPLKRAWPGYGGALPDAACLRVAGGNVAGGQHLPRLLKGFWGHHCCMPLPQYCHRGCTLPIAAVILACTATAAAACHTLHAAPHMIAG